MVNIQTDNNKSTKNIISASDTLRICLDAGFGPLDENEAANGAGIFTSWVLCITADGDLSLTRN